MMSMSEKIALAVAVVVGLPFALLGYLAVGEAALRFIPRSRAWRDRLRPWWWLLPGFALMGMILGYSIVDTIRLSFLGPNGQKFVGLANVRWIGSSGYAHSALKTTAIWVILLPLITVALGLLTAVLADRVRYERIAKSLLIVPTAMSFVAAAVIWQGVYSFQPAGATQIGLLNALWTKIPGTQPIAWLVDGSVDNYALIAVAIWMYLGFAMLVLSAAIKGIPRDLLEAARIDGASEWHVFTGIMLPELWPVLAVVLTTLVAWALKIFDIVYVATGGRFGTEVVATAVYQELFTNFNTGYGSVLALILTVAAFPIMILNVWRVRRQGGL